MSSAEKELQKTQRIDSAHVLRFLRSVQRINILSIPQLWVRRLRPFYSEKQIVQAVRLCVPHKNEEITILVPTRSVWFSSTTSAPVT